MNLTKLLAAFYRIELLRSLVCSRVGKVRQIATLLVLRFLCRDWGFYRTDLPRSSHYLTVKHDGSKSVLNVI